MNFSKRICGNIKTFVTLTKGNHIVVHLKKLKQVSLKMKSILIYFLPSRSLQSYKVKKTKIMHVKLLGQTKVFMHLTVLNHFILSTSWKTALLFQYLSRPTDDLQTHFPSVEGFYCKSIQHLQLMVGIPQDRSKF